ncbi:uncharacterized protein LOC132835896 [Hemiscyllium ocellatum]|uniref:uncharacterized protein LOC132835896 n=1 Tax=Hemiscyllium ocellatum TaxID=170820 RepID=UPI0029667575|nr:uncharacterized protein LOC132835896 [Hemiscyllium ocellatum]
MIEMFEMIRGVNWVDKKKPSPLNGGISDRGGEGALTEVPVAGVSLINKANKTEILIGSRLVLECELSRGTGPFFQWYFQQEALNNASGNYNFSSDRRELDIESFQSQHQGRYQCGAINRAPSGTIFNVTSNFIDLTVPAQAHSAEMAVLIVPLFLILSLITLLPIKLRNRKQADSSSSSQQHREAMGNRTEGTSENRPVGNFEYATIRPSRMNDDSKTDGSLVYSVITISKPRNAARSDGASGGKHTDQEEQQQSCITYATLRHTDTGGEEEPGQDEEGNIYANLPRIS